MKTIESYESEILSKITLCQEGMTLFKSNIPRIVSIIGRDPSIVYDTLESSLASCIDRFNTMGLKNASTLQPIVDKLDRILMILAEVSESINEMNTSDESNVSALDVKNSLDQVIDQAAAAVDTLKPGAEAAIAKAGTMVKNPPLALAGGAAGFLMARKVGFGAILSLAAGLGVAYWAGNKE